MGVVATMSVRGREWWIGDVVGGGIVLEYSFPFPFFVLDGYVGVVGEGFLRNLVGEEVFIG